MKIIVGPASKELAIRTAELANCEKIHVINKRFPDGEIYVRIDGDVKDDIVAIIQTTSPPQNYNLLQLAFIANAAKLAGAKKVIAITPYLAYARQDKIFLSGENISVETIAGILRVSGVDELITINVHQEIYGSNPCGINKILFAHNILSCVNLIFFFLKTRGSIYLPPYQSMYKKTKLA